MKKVKFAKNLLFILGIICYVSLLSLIPFMHNHDHGHEHEEGEPFHTDDRCPACVFINSHVDFNIQPPTLITQTQCNETPSTTIVIAKSFNPIENIHKRAPPIVSNLSINNLYSNS